MKKSIVRILLGLLTLFLVFFLYLIWGTIQNANRERDLANVMNIDLSTNKAFAANFPTHYFYLTLNPGMSIDEVHKRVTNYKKVLNCSNTWEIYYYYTDDNDTARRFEISYDEERRFKELRGEEDDSPTIQITGCVEGTLEP